MSKRFEAYYKTKCLTDLTENQIITFFTKMRSGEIKRIDGGEYKSVVDFILNCKNTEILRKRNDLNTLEEIKSALEGILRHCPELFELLKLNGYYSFFHKQKTSYFRVIPVPFSNKKLGTKDWTFYYLMAHSAEGRPTEWQVIGKDKRLRSELIEIKTR